MRFALASALALVLAVPVLAQAPRPGADLRFATLGSSGGLQGSAFLPIAPSDVRALARTATCPRARIEARARGLRGMVRELRFSLPDVSTAGTVTIGTACDQATVKAKLEDGSEVEGTGTLEVTRVERTGPIK